jgi:hypothetical protein
LLLNAFLASASSPVRLARRRLALFKTAILPLPWNRPCQAYPELATDQTFFDFQTIDKAKIAALPEATRTQVEGIQRETKQLALADIAVLPAIMCVCYLGLIMYFKSRGGYKAQVLAGHSADDGKFTGGVRGHGG